MSDQVQLGSQAESFVDRVRSAFLYESGYRDFYEVVPRLDLLEKNWSLWRLDRSGVRYYYNPDRDEFYPSTTSVTWNTLPESKFLTDWKIGMALKSGDPDSADNYMNERSAYGTLMHILFTEILMSGRIHSDQVEEIVFIYKDVYDLSHLDVRPWVNELKSDVSAFFEWLMIFEVEPLAIEIPMFHPVFHSVWLPEETRWTYVVGWIGGTVDLVCNMWGRRDGGDITPRTPMNNRVRIRTIVDYKSGKKGFYDSHEIQINDYFHGWNWIQNEFLAGEYPVTRCYNFAPNNSYGDKATFKFVNQTNSDHYKKMPHLLSQFMLDGRHQPGNIRFVEGEFEVGKSGSQHVHLLSASEYIKQKYGKKEE